MDILFDTSAINYLADHVHSDQMRRRMLAFGWRSIISLVNVIELVETANVDRRRLVCALAKGLREDGRYRILDAPDRMLVHCGKVWETRVGLCHDVTIQKERFYAFLEDPVNISEAHHALLAKYKSDWQTCFENWMLEARAKLEPLAPSLLLTPEKVIDLVCGPSMQEGLTPPGFSKPLPTGQVLQYIHDCEPYRMWWEAMGLSLFYHSYKCEGLKQKKHAGYADVSQAVYLAFVDAMVTNDPKQRLRIAELCELRHPNKNVMSCEDFERTLFS